MKGIKERKGDARVYVISCFFFLCVLSGGVLLGLYIFLPETFSESWYPIAGMVLIGIPWLFWLFAYIYRCFVSPSGNRVYNRPSSAATTPSSRTPAMAETAATAPASSSEEESPVQSPGVSPGRHVHFGAVVVMGSEGNNKNRNGDQNGTGEGHLRSSIPESDHQGESADKEIVSKKASVHPRESEIPLAYSSGC